MRCARNCSLVREIGCSNVKATVSREGQARQQPLSMFSLFCRVVRLSSRRLYLLFVASRLIKYFAMPPRYWQPGKHGLCFQVAFPYIYTVRLSVPFLRKWYPSNALRECGTIHRDSKINRFDFGGQRSKAVIMRSGGLRKSGLLNFLPKWSKVNFSVNSYWDYSTL